MVHVCRMFAAFCAKFWLLLDKSFSSVAASLYRICRFGSFGEGNFLIEFAGFLKVFSSFFASGLSKLFFRILFLWFPFIRRCWSCEKFSHIAFLLSNFSGLIKLIKFYWIEVWLPNIMKIYVGLFNANKIIIMQHSIAYWWKYRFSNKNRKYSGILGKYSKSLGNRGKIALVKVCS